MLMNRQTIVRLLLSLLLLASQQMAMTHVLSHWSGSSRVQADKASSLSKSIAQDQSCDQCLSFAQIAGAVGSDARHFAVTGIADGAVLSELTQADPQPPTPAFRSRAPPAIA